MLLRPINAQSLRGNFELVGGEAKGQEGENPDENPDSVSRETLQRANVHGLRAGAGQSGRSGGYRRHSLVAQPVAEINALDHGGGPFVALEAGDGLEHVFDVAMAPVLALDGGDGGDIWDVSGAGPRGDDILPAPNAWAWEGSRRRRTDSMRRKLVSWPMLV